MTPQEQQLVADLFDRLASLEDQRRDPDAERLIREGLGRAPNSVYALVQTVLLQDEALKRANARIEALERAAAAPAESGGSFLDGMRNILGGRSDQRGSVPSVRPGGMGTSGVWGSGADTAGSGPVAQPWGNQPGYPQGGYPPPPPPPAYQPMGAPMGGGGSFLGTAAATVAGVVGGAMLLNGIRSMMGHETFPHAYDPAGAATPGASSWDGGGDHGHLGQDAGLSDIGGRHAAAYDDGNANAANDDGFLGGSVDDLADGDFDGDDFDGGGGDFDAA
ncbi:MAG: DUF2076 domain-containing protein [Bradyrhizobiaceae bacterium]|nr:DUF2076 domain-containing protein [Bradyrhizobiaceae bacterium]